MAVAFIKCEVCGAKCGLTWIDEHRWTGRCETCGTIYDNLSKDEVVLEIDPTPHKENQ
jgi:hypothetical protein